MDGETPPNQIEQLEFDVRVLEAVVAALLAELPRDVVRGLLIHFDLTRRPPGPEINPAETKKYDALHRVFNHAHEFVELVARNSESHK